MKKIVATILAFAIIVCAVPFSPLVVEAYSSAYPNTHTNTGNQLEDIIAVAESQVGYTYSSGTKYGASFGSSFTSAHWCAMFVSWCADQAGIPTSIIPKHADCDEGMNWFKSNGRWQDGEYYGGTYIPQRGDIVYYSNDFDQSDSTHVGIVVGVSGNYLQVIEGNTSDGSYSLSTSKVCLHTNNNKRTLNHGYVLGYGTPDYSGGSVDLGTDFYAYIICTEPWKHLTNDSTNVSLRTETGDANQIWYFERQSDGSYSIKSALFHLFL